MKLKPVTDPSVLEQLQPVTDPALLQALNGGNLRTPISDLPLDPTSGMSGLEKFAAGAGKTFTGMGRGIQQAALAPYQGAPVEARQAELSGQEAEARRLDAPLSATRSGKAGEIAGGVAAAVPTVFIPGANTYAGSTLIGAGMGAIQPTAQPGERMSNIGTGAAAGFGSQAIGRLAASLMSGGKALADPLTRGGQDRIAGRTIRGFAGGPINPTPAATPGWQPTAAEATQNPGIAVLQRGVESSNPEAARMIAERQFAQNASAIGALEKIAGTPAEQAAAKAAQRAAGAGYEAATSQAIDPAIAASMRPQIESLMARPSMKLAAQRAGEIFDESQIAQTKAGSAKGMQYLKQALDDIIEKAGTPGSSIGKNQLAALQQTRSDLLSTMQELAPELRSVDKAYAAASRPVNEMAAGQALTEKLRPALMDYAPGAPTRLNAQQYANAMRNIEEVLPGMTGFSGSTVQNTFTPQNQQLMTGVAQDLARRAGSAEMARGPGSNTAQNLSTKNVLRQTLGPLGVPERWTDTTLLQTLAKPLNLIYGGVAEPAAQRKLAEALLDPAMAAKLSAAPPPTSQLPFKVMSRLPMAGVPIMLNRQNQ